MCCHGRINGVDANVAQRSGGRHPGVSAAIGASLMIVVPSAHASATPLDGAPTVGTAVYVVMHKSFTATGDPAQCVGAVNLAAIRPGSTVYLWEGSSSSSPTIKVAVGQHYRSRLGDGQCEALYITSAPVLTQFNVQFVGAGSEASPTFGPITSHPVTDQPGIQQMIRVDLGVDP